MLQYLRSITTGQLGNCILEASIRRHFTCWPLFVTHRKMLPTATPNLLMDPSQQETTFEGFCALIQDTIHGTSVCTPEAGEQQKRGIARNSDGTSPPRTKQETSRAPRPQTQAKLASLFSAMAKHNEDSPRYTPPVDPAAVPVEIGVCRLELSRHVCLELSWHVYTHNTHMRACCTTSGLPRNSQSARQLRYTQIRGSADLPRI